jgi:hypothetical protein
MTSTPALRLLPALLAATALAPAALAQTPTFLVSTSGDPGGGFAGAPTLEDASLVRLRAGEAPRAWFVEGNWLAAAGLVPGDIDGLALRPGATAFSAASVVFSTLSNEGQFLDGDVLGLASGGGLEMLVAEETLVASLGLSGTTLDLDGLAFDGEGRLLYSLQSNHSSPLLGEIADGDVLRLEPSGSSTRLVTEEQVTADFQAVTGLATAVADVQGIDWVNGELWVAVQSPTSHDGGVLALGANARMVAEESALGLGGEELDGLVVIDADGTSDAPLALWIDSALSTAPGVAAGGTPHGLGLVLIAGQGGFEGAGYLGGFGAWYLDALDPLLAVQLAGGGGQFLFDGTGRFEAATQFAPGSGGSVAGGGTGWTLQVLDLSQLRLSPPFRVTT